MESILQAQQECYQEVFEYILDGLLLVEVTKHQRFRVIDMNPVFERNINIPRAKLIGLFLEDIFPQEFLQVALPHYQTCIATAEVMHFEQEFEVAAGMRTFQSTLIPLKNESNQVHRVLSIARDVTEGKLLDELRHAREQELRALVENSPDIIVRYDTNCKRIFTNPASDEVFGMPADEFIGKSPTELSILGEQATQYEKMLKQVIATGIGNTTELIVRRANGTHEYYSIHATPEFNRDGHVCSVLSTGRNITAHKQAESFLAQSHAELRQLAIRQETVREQERKRIAKEIHDELGQNLTALSLDIALLRNHYANKDPYFMQKTESMLHLVSTTTNMLRQVVSELRPMALDMGVIPALQWQVREFCSHNDVECTLDLAKELQLLDEYRGLVVFRVVQESLTNISRHAHADKVAISLTLNDECYYLRIQDNGRGFDTALPSTHSFGLQGMKERLSSLDGTLEIHSAPKQGTLIDARFPFYHPELRRRASDYYKT